MAETNPQNPPPFSSEGTPTLQQLAEYVVELLHDPEKLKKWEETQTNAIARGSTIAQTSAVAGAHYFMEHGAAPLVGYFVKALLAAMQFVEPVTTEVAKIAIDSLLGDGPKRAPVPGGVGQKILSKLAPAGGVVEPGIGGATNYIDVMVGLQMETWLLGFIAEMVGDTIGLVDVGGATFRSVAEIREVVAQVFGGARITRRVLAPFIDDGIVTPAKWATQKQYRPTLLGAAAAIEAYLRGDWDFPTLNEELGRQGFSPERINILIANAEKRVSFADLSYLFEHGTLTSVQAIDRAVTLGYDRETAETLLQLETSKRQDQLFAPLISEAVEQFLNGDIDELTMERWVKVATKSDLDRYQIVETAKARRAVRVKRISSSRMRALALDGYAAVRDFTKALEREGYPLEDITIEEIALRAEIGKKHNLEKKPASVTELETLVLAGDLALGDFTDRLKGYNLTEDAQAITVAVLQARLDKQTADAEAKAAAEEAKRLHEEELKVKRARAFPSLQEYRRAYVRGFLARETYAAALEREKVVGDDAAFLLADADSEHEQFLADEEKRQQKLAEGEHKDLSVATLEQGVLAGTLELSAFDAYLAKVGYVDADRRLLVRLVQDKLDDQAAAKAKRDEAEQRAVLRQVSLADWERAVRLGVRSLAAYAGFLEQLGLDAPARALITDVLGAQLAADEEARTKREQREKEARQRGISLSERRRVVIEGLRPRTYYAEAIQQAGWPVDDQLADLDLLDVEIAAAAAARARKKAIEEQLPPSIVSIAQLEHAVVLGFITPVEYRAILIGRGATADDADLLVALAVAKIPDTGDDGDTHDTIDKALAAKGISLADLEAAVQRGIVTLDDYARELANRGYVDADVLLMRQLLEERVGLDIDGLRAKIVAALAKGGAEFTLEELDAALVAGEVDAPTAQGALVAAGVPRDAALVYTRLRARG